jgi:hypothetical protein
VARRRANETGPDEVVQPVEEVLDVQRAIADGPERASQQHALVAVVSVVVLAVQQRGPPVSRVAVNWKKS